MQKNKYPLLNSGSNSVGVNLKQAAIYAFSSIFKGVRYAKLYVYMFMCIYK